MASIKSIKNYHGSPQKPYNVEHRYINSAEHPRYPDTNLKLEAIKRCFSLGENVEAVFFLLLLILKMPVVNIFLFLIAKMAAGCAAGAVWSIYIPGLAESGLVSSANGVIDSAGYATATVANIIFSLAMSKIGWSGTIVIWGVIMAIAVNVILLNVKIRGHFDNTFKLPDN